MKLHLAITGGNDEAKDTVRRVFDRPGVAVDEEWATLVEGRQRFPTREQVELAGPWWAGRIAQRVGQTGKASRVWAIDYEMTREGADIRREWMAGRIELSQDMAAYMGAARAGAYQLGTVGGGEILPDDAEVVWLLLPQLIGTDGFTDQQIGFMASLLDLVKASRLSPSFRPRRLIGRGITADAQRRRVAVGYAQIAERFGSDAVVPELCPTYYNDGRIEAVPEQDIEAQIRGLSDAGCDRVVVWAQGEPEVAMIIAGHCRAFVAGVARAGHAEPR